MSDQNNVDGLRNILFDTMKQLKDKDNPMEIDRARAIADVAQVVINSAKAEIDYAKATGSPNTSRFLCEQQEDNQPKVGGYVHKIRG